MDQAHLEFQEGHFVKSAYTAQQAIGAGAGAGGEILLGHIYRNMKEYDAAKAAYQRALEIAPTNTAAKDGIRKAETAAAASR